MTLFALALFVWPGLMMWALVVWFIPGDRDAPPLNDVTPLNTGRRVLGWLVFVMSGPGHGSSPGQRQRFSTAESSVPSRLGGLSVPGQGEERRKPQADPCRAFLCLQALGFEKPVRQDRAAAPQGTPDPLSAPLRHSEAPRLSRGKAAGLRLRPRVPLGERPFPNRLPVRGIDPAHLVRSPEGGEEIVALRIKGKGSVFQDVSFPDA